MQYEEDKKKIEMSFDLTHYQPQFRGEKPSGPGAAASERNTTVGKGNNAEQEEANVAQAGENRRTVLPPSPPSSSSSNEDENEQEQPGGKGKERVREPPLESHVFQTIFLDRDSSSHLWTIDSIRPSSIISERWWKQQSHRWQHYAKVVPFMFTLNALHSSRHTVYAGAWTLLNMHEIAIVSGFSAAYRLGADFAFKGDEECERLWKLYYAVAHGGRVRKEDRKGFFA